MTRKAVGPFCFFLLALSGCSREVPFDGAEHRQAKARFLELVRNGFKAEPEEVLRVLQASFRKGDPAGPYEDLLKTAKYRPGREDDRCDRYYFWDWDDGLDGREVAVGLGGSPPVIVGAGITTWMR